MVGGVPVTTWVADAGPAGLAGVLQGPPVGPGPGRQQPVQGHLGQLGGMHQVELGLAVGRPGLLDGAERLGAVVEPDTILAQLSNPDLMRQAEEARYGLEIAKATFAEFERCGKDPAAIAEGIHRVLTDAPLRRGSAAASGRSVPSAGGTSIHSPPWSFA